MKRVIHRATDGRVLNVGDMPDDQVEAFKAAIDAEQKFGDPSGYTVEIIDTTAEYEHAAKKMSRVEERQLCLDVIDEIGILNSDLGVEPSVMFANPQFSQIALALLLGMPKTARDVIAAVGPSMYPQDKVDAIVAKITAEVGP